MSLRPVNLRIVNHLPITSLIPHMFSYLRTPRMSVTSTHIPSQPTRLNRRWTLFMLAILFFVSLGTAPALAQPTVTGLQPADGTVLASGTGTLTGTVTGATTLSIDGDDVTIGAGGSFSWSFDLSEGSNVVQIYAEDGGGQSTSLVHQLVLDTQNPQVSVTQPSSSVVGSQPVQVAGTYFEPHLTSLTVAGVAATASGGTWDVTVPLVEGPQALTVAAQDSLGHQTSFPITLTLDTLAPTLTVTESGAAFSGGLYTRPVTPVVTASDATDLTLELVLDGVPFVSGTIVSEEGSHTLGAIATDDAGNVTSVEIDFVVDTTAPTIGAIQPAAGTVLPATDATLQIETGSGAYGADLVRVTGPSGSAESSGSGLFTVGPVALSEGTNDLLVEAFDDAGNRATRSYRLVRDTTPPVLTVSAPSDGDVVSAATVPAQGVAQDARLQSVTVNGLLANLVGEGWSVADVPLVDGTNVLTVIATDTVGNQTTQTVTVERDTAAPVFQVLVDGVELVSGATFAGPVSPVIQVDEVQFPGATIAATLDGATFTSGTEVSSDGSHELAVTVTSGAGVSSSRLLVFTIDQQTPTVSNVLPADGHLQQEADVSVSGTVSGAQVVAVDGQAATLFQGNFSAGPFTLAEGVRTFTIVATGANGLETTLQHSVERDSTPPQVAISSPADGALVGEVAITVSGTAVDPNLLSVTVNETPAVISASTWNAHGVPLREGSTTLTARAEDAAGNVAEVTRTVLLDTEAPQITITDPAPGSLVPDATYEVRGTVTEEHLDRIDVAVTAVSTGDTSSVQATVQEGTFFVSVPLAEGTNQIMATARDLLGASTSDSASIERDAEAPQVRIVVPGDGESVNNPSLEVRGTVNDVTGNDEEGISVRVNGLVAVIDRGAWVVVGLDLSPGENTLLARATDAQGNEGVHTRTVILDQDPPQFVSADPASGALSLPVDAVFRLEFSEPLADPEDGSWALYSSPATGAGSPLAATAVVDGSELRITPDVPLPSEETVVLTLSAALTDLAGNALANPPSPLTYQVVDVGAPDAVSLDFEPSRFLCSPDIVLSGTSEPAARVEAEGGASLASVRSEDDGSFLLEVELLRERLNRLELTATDAEGNVSPATVVEVVHDCTGPEVATSELIGQTLAIGFTEAVDEATVTGGGGSGGSVTVSDAAGALTFTVVASASGDEATLTLASAPAGSVLLDVGTGVRDLAANALAFPYRRVFGDASGAESFVSGTVIDDATGRPLAGATVQITATDGQQLGEPLPQQTTGSDGRFLIPVASGTHDLTAARPGYTPVFRIVTTQAGEGTNVFDPRLTPTSTAATVGTAGGTVTADGAPEASDPAAQLTLPSGAVAQSTSVRLTQLGEQSLPALLPYGWSPRGAVWVDSEEAFLASGTLSLPARSALGTTPAGTLLYIVTLDVATLQWHVESQATVTNGQVQASVPSIGAYVAVEADTGANAPPAAVVGQVLGSSPSPVGGEVESASLTFDPEVVLPTQRARATATYTLAAGLEDAPSGLPLTLVIEEELELLDGSILREAPYRTDLIVYRDDLGTPSSEFWLRPSETARSEPIQLGGEDVTILPYGDESVRGNVLGPEGGAVLSDEGDQLDVPAGALTSPAAIVLERQTAADLPLATPRGATIDAVLDLDLGGARLELPASLSIAMDTPPAAGSKGLLLQVVEVETDQGLVTTFQVLAELLPTSGGWQTDIIDALDLAWPGVRTEGQLAAVQLSEPHGFVRGEVVSNGGQPVAGAVVSSDSVDWVQISDLEGRYVLPLPLGDHVVTSRSAQTGNAVQVAVTVSTEDERVDLDPTLQIVAPWIAEVTPADGSQGIPVGVEPTVRFSEPVDRTTLPDGLELLLDGVPVQVEFDHQGDFVRVLPAATLVPGQTYELRIGAEIRDLDGYALNGILTTSFRTEADPSTSGQLDRSKVKTLAPDSQGLATVIGQAGAVPGNTLVYVENLTSYSTTESVTSTQDGAFQLTIGAALDDRLLLHVLIQGGSEDLMTLGPFLSADEKSAYIPEDGGDWTTSEGLGIEVQPGTFTRPTWVRAETRASGPVETPDGFNRLFDFDITLGGLLPSKRIYVSVPTTASFDPQRDILLNRFVEALGTRGWMFMDLLRAEGGVLTNAPLGSSPSGVAKSGAARSASEVSLYAPPERQGVWTLEHARSEEAELGSAQFKAPIRVSWADQQRAEERKSLYQAAWQSLDKSQPITDPRDSALGVVEPGTYQGAQLQTQQPIAWAAIPVDRPDLMVTSDSFGGVPYVCQVTTRILTLMTGPWVIIPTQWNEPFTLEVRDLTTGYVLGRSVQDAPTEELTLYPEDVYSDDAPPLPVGGNPIRFFLLNPADPIVGVEIVQGITYDYSDNEELDVTGAPDAVPVDVEVSIYSLRTGDTDSTVAASTGGFSLTLSGVEPHDTVILAVSSKIGPGDTLEIRFSEALAPGAAGIELHGESGGGISPNPVESARVLLQDGTLLRIRPSTGWKKGAYELRLTEELLGKTEDDEARELRVGLEVEGSSYLDTLELDNVGDMAQLGSLLYMAALGDGLVVWDVTHPKAPRPMLTDVDGDPYGFPFPNGAAVRGVDIDSHGRAVVVGGGEANFGQLKVIDILAVDWEAAGNTSDPSAAVAQAFRGSTLISDSLVGTIQTVLRNGTPRRVAVAANDSIDTWRIWKDAPPAGVTIQPATKPDGAERNEVQVEFSGSGLEPKRAVSIHNVTRGRWDRGESGEGGEWTVSASLKAGDEVQLRRNSEVWAYATIDGAGIAVVDVASILDQDVSDPNIASTIVQTADGLPVGEINVETECDPSRVNISSQPIDIEVLYDPESSPQLSVFTLYAGYGFGIQGASPAEPGVLGAVSAACGAVEGRAVLTAMEVVQDYPMDFDGDGQFSSSETSDYAILAHAAGHLLIYDVSLRSNPIPVARIPMGKEGEQIHLASLSVDRRHRRILAAAFGEGLYVIDFSHIGSSSMSRIDSDDDGIDDRVLETIEVTAEEVTEILLMPDYGIAFAGGRQRGLTSLLVGPPRVETVSADQHSLRYVQRAAPYGVTTAAESEDEDAAEYPGLVRFQVQMPGLSDDTSTSTEPQSHIFLNVAGVGPDDEPFDGAGDALDMPPAAYLDLDALRLERQADDPWEEGYRLYLSEPVVLLSDLRASAAYEETEDELEVCTRCDLIEEEVYEQRPLSAEERYDELLSGHKLLAAFTDRGMEQEIESFYDDSPFQESASRVTSVPWDISPSTRQEPRHNPSTGQGDVAPGTLLHSGEMTLDATDVAIAGRGLNFAFRRTYRNQTVGSGPLGPGWDHSYRIRLRELPDGDVEIFDGQGRRDLFTVKDDSEFEAPKGWFVELKRTSAGWTLTDPARNILRFDRWGRLVSISDPLRSDEDHGSQLTFHYDANSRLGRVDDSLDRAIRFEYDDDGKLSSIQDFTDREWSYGYGGEGMLETVDAPPVETLDNKSGSMTKSSQPLRTTYAYRTGGSTLRDLLIGRDNIESVKDPKEQEWLRLAWTDADGDGLEDEIETQTWGEHTVSLTLDPDANTASVTDRRSNVNEYQFNSRGQTTRITDPKQAAWIFEYDDEGLLEKRTEPDGRTTETAFHTDGDRRARGNAETITVTPGAGGENGSSQSLVTRMEYHPKTNQPTKVTTSKGTVTEIDRHPETGLTQSITRDKGTEDESTESFSYNDFGQVKEITDALGKVTKIEYFDAEAGDLEEYEGYAKHVVEDVSNFALQTTFEVDDLGRRVAVVDPRGVRTEHEFNDLGWHLETRTAVTGSNDGAPPLNYVTTVQYDANGNVARAQVPVGEAGETSTNEFTYGVLDEVTETKQQAGSGQEIVETWDYDENYNPIRHTDGEGQISETDFDVRNLPETIRRGLGINALAQPIVEQLLFDDSRRFKVFTDGRSNAWTREYDGYGRVRESLDPLGNKTTWEYDNHSQATKIQAYEGATLLSEVGYAFDARSRMMSMTQKMLQPQGLPSGKTSPVGDLVTSFDYDDLGNVTKVTDPKGRERTFTYDSMHRTETVVDPMGNVQRLDYDDASNVTQSTMEEMDGDGAQHNVPTTFERDALGRMTLRRNALGHSWTYDLGADGRARRMTDPGGFTTTHTYDLLGRMTGLTRPEGISETYSYDKAHRVKTYLDALGQTTTYEYDAAHRQTLTTYADGGTVQLEYDPTGHLEKRTDQLGTKVTMTWDEAGRRRSATAVPGPGVSLAGSLSETYDYDGLGRLTSALSGNVLTELAYDSASRLISESTNGRSVEYGLDEMGMPVSVTDSSGHETIRTYDGLDRLETIGTATDVLGDYRYRGAGPVVHTRSLWNGLETSVVFDGARRPTGQKITAGPSPEAAAHPVYHEEIAWSQRNLKVGSTRHDMGLARTFSYDGAGRLDSWSRVPDVEAALGQATKTSIAPDESFEFNPAQALIGRTRTVAGIEQTTTTPPDSSGRNRPASVGGIPLIWDANGNLIERGARRFVHDWRNRIREVIDSQTGETLAEYEYDAFNRRISKTVGDQTIETVYQGWQEAEQYQNDQLKERRFFGQGLEEMVKVEKDLDGDGILEQEQVPVYDSSGNLALIANADGRPQERYEYTSFGQMTILGSHISPEVEQVRVVGDEIWIETSLAISESLAQQAISEDRIYLELSDGSTQFEIDAHQPIQTGRNARRRLIITTTDPPAAGTPVRLFIPKGDFQDEFWNPVDADLDLTFTWDTQVVLDTAAPRISHVIVQDGHLEVNWSEKPDLATATIQITLDGQPLAWTLDETSYALTTDTNVGLGEKTLSIGTGPSDLSGQGLVQAFNETFTVETGQDQVVYLAPNPRELGNSAVANNYGFQGRPVDRETGLMYFRNRYYDPEAGIFVTADPLGYVDGPSMYAFAGFDPVNSGDPMGLYDEASAEQRRRDTNRRLTGERKRKARQFRADLVEWLEGVDELNQRDELFRKLHSLGLNTADRSKVMNDLLGPEGSCKGLVAKLHCAMGSILAGQGEILDIYLQIAMTAVEGLDAVAPRGLADDVIDVAKYRTDMAEEIAAEVAKQERLVIGRVDDLAELGEGERVLLDAWPDQGSSKGNWKKNSGALRREMGRGQPIRDASVDPLTGKLIEHPGRFIELERELLRSRGWKYDRFSRLWKPPA